MNPFQKFVSESARIFRSGKKLSPDSLKIPAVRNLSPDAPTALIFSPHPDDECIIGGLALRLAHEAGWNIINVAVTLGSKGGRRAARRRELQSACAALGFDLVVPGGRGLEQINPEARQKHRAHWTAAVKSIALILRAHQPRVVFVPHEADGHATHIGTHWLVLDALKTLPKDFKCFVVETEFWGQMPQPNLLVESSEKDVSNLVGALACHVGEVRRNPYHARLPAWLMDNVRRGAEQVGVPGGPSPDFTFGTMYRLRRWRAGRMQNAVKGGKILDAGQNLAALFGS